MTTFPKEPVAFLVALLLIHLDFKLDNSKLNRKDKLDLYAKTINETNIDLHLEKIISFGAKIDFSDLENAFTQ